MYKALIKRIIDIFCSSLALILFCWLYIIIALLVFVKLGKPVLFKQIRPGRKNKITGKECLFTMYKFRTMTDKRDIHGNFLPDAVRLTRFGSWLRSTSLDELPELFNIFKGDMSIIGPRPQLVRDMVFMTPDQRQRHSVRPGLSGLAQVNGRNAITWDEKLNFDLQYVKEESFFLDVKLILQTIGKVFKREDITELGMETAEDYGEYLYHTGKITMEEWQDGLMKAKELVHGE